MPQIHSSEPLEECAGLRGTHINDIDSDCKQGERMRCAALATRACRAAVTAKQDRMAELLCMQQRQEIERTPSDNAAIPHNLRHKQSLCLQVHSPDVRRFLSSPSWACVANLASHKHFPQQELKLVFKCPGAPTMSELTARWPMMPHSARLCSAAHTAGRLSGWCSQGVLPTCPHLAAGGFSSPVPLFWPVDMP